MTEPKKDIVTDLCERMHALWLRSQVVFGSTNDIPHNIPYIPLAEALLRGLAEGDGLAIPYIWALVDKAEMDRPAFWGTDLGRLLFATDKGAVPISQTVAAAVLGCSRQWVSAMVKEGKLTALADGRMVYSDEVRRVLKARVDRLVNKV
jgi:hypothetical protein